MLGHKETSDDREERPQPGAGEAGPGRAMDEGKVSQIVESFSSLTWNKQIKGSWGCHWEAYLSLAVPSGAPCSENN